MREAALWLTVVLSASSCVHSLECSVHGGPTWLDVRSTHFELQTNKPLELAKKEIAVLEKLHFVMRWLFSLEADPDDPLLVISVADSNDLLEFGIDAAGLAVPVGASRYLVITGSPQSSKHGEEAPVFAHELAHLASRNAMPLQPHWLSEGLAEYAGATQFLDAATAKVGLMPKRWVDVAGVAPIDQLWSWSYDTMSDAQRQWFYFSAWAWVHYLFNNEGERFHAFIEQTKSGGDPKVLFERAFPLQWQQQTKPIVDGYVRKGTYYSTTLRVPTPELLLTTRELTPGEVHLLRSKLARNGTATLSEETRNRRVADELEKARGLHSPLSMALWEALREKDPTLEPPVPTTPREEARVLFVRAQTMAWGPTLASLKVAQQKSPNDPQVLAALSDASRELDDGAETSLQLATRARQLRPWWWAAWSAESTAALLAGRAADAVRAVSRLLDLVQSSPELVARAQHRLEIIQRVAVPQTGHGGVTEVMRSAQARFEACGLLAEKPGPTQVSLLADIGTDGKVHGTTIVTASLDRSVRDCVRGVARMLTFEAAPAPQQAMVTIDLQSR